MTGAKGENSVSSKNSTSASVTLDRCDESNSSNFSEDDTTTLVNTSDTTEPENTDSDCSTTTLGNKSVRGVPEMSKDPHGSQQQRASREAFKELLAKNEELRRELDSKSIMITEAERNHKVILDENALLAAEIQDVQRTTSDRKSTLEAELLKSFNERKILQERIMTMRNGVQELNGMLSALITQFSGDGSQGGPLKALLRKSNPVGRLAITQPGSHHSNVPANQNASTPNVIQLALQRLQPRMITAGPANASPKASTSKVPKS